MNEITRLNFENLLWVLFIIACLLNIFGDNKEKDYLKSKQKNDKDVANNFFMLALIIAFLIYIYFFYRNYEFLKRADENSKRLYEIKLLGSAFLIAGVICLIYFQYNNTTATGSPAI